MEAIKKYIYEEYGKVVEKFRRGLITLDEAEYLWNEIAGRGVALTKLAEDPELQYIIEKGLAS